MKRITIATLLAGLIAGPLTAHAIPFSFDCVSNNNTTNCATGENQFLVDVYDAGSGRTGFLFTNSGPSRSSIADIYWDWLVPANAFAPGTISESAGVDFGWGASPGNLPGGNGMSPQFSAELATDSNPPVQPNGVNPGEWVRFVFQNTVFDNVINDLNTGALRVGIHAQGFANGGSETFVTVGQPPTPTPVPEPGTLAFLGLGLLGAGAARKRFK